MKRNMIVALALGALLLGGCSSSSDSPNTAAPGAPAGEAVVGTQDKGAKAPEGVTATTGPVEGRALVYRGDVTIRVENVEVSADKVEAIASSLGGHVSSQKRVAGTRDARATITMRIPSKNFDSALDQVAALGKEESRNSNTEDVTEAIVDLDTRIAAQKASVESVRKMFERATALSDVVLLERELSQRQAELAALEAKKRKLDDLVSLSTITISLAGPNTEIAVEDSSPGFLGGLKAGWKAFVASVNVMLVVIGWLLPFAVAVAVPVMLIIWLARLRGRRRQPEQQPDALEG